MTQIDSTKELLTDIISWEKDLSEYESLESILRKRYNIQKRKALLKPLVAITDAQCIELCSQSNPLPFSQKSSKWVIDRKKEYIIVSYKYNTHSFSIDLVGGDVDSYIEGELITTDNQANLTKWWWDNGFDIFNCMSATVAKDENATK